MTVERTFFKLMYIGLVLLTIVTCIGMVSAFSILFASLRQFGALGAVSAVLSSMQLCAQFLLSLSALIFVPIIVRRNIPEVR
ncbi:MAG: hypothetical protein AAFU80_05235 [Pseudomonadota bacterium]